MHEPLIRRLRDWYGQETAKTSTLDWPKITTFVDGLISVIQGAPRRADFRVLPFGWPTRKVSVAS